MADDLEIIRKIREKEDAENDITRELKDTLSRELEVLRKEGNTRISETRTELMGDYENKMKSLRKKMEELRDSKISEAKAKADSVKLHMSDADLRDLASEILKKYLED